MRAVLARSGSPKVFSMFTKISSRVWKCNRLSIIAIVSFAAHICAVSPHMNERVYRIFILSSTKVSACMVMAIWMDCMNSSVFSQLPLKLSGSAAFTLLPNWDWDWVGVLAWGLVVMAWATADAVAEATLVMSLQVSATRAWRNVLVS